MKGQPVTKDEIRAVLALQKQLEMHPVPRTATLRCRVVAVEGAYRAPDLMKRELSTEERLGNLEPQLFRLMLHGTLTADDGDAMRALAALSRSGGSVTVRVEVGE